MHKFTYTEIGTVPPNSQYVGLDFTTPQCAVTGFANSISTFSDKLASGITTILNLTLQNLINSSLVNSVHIPQISQRYVHNLSSYPIHKRTNRQSNGSENSNTPELAEIINNTIN